MLKNRLKMVMIGFCLLISTQCSSQENEIKGEVELPASIKDSLIEITLSSFPKGIDDYVQKAKLVGNSYRFSNIESGYFNLWIKPEGQQALDIPIYISKKESLYILTTIGFEAGDVILSSVEFTNSDKNYPNIYDIHKFFEIELTSFEEKRNSHVKNKESYVGFDFPFEDLLENFANYLDGGGASQYFAAALLVKNSDRLKQIKALDESKELFIHDLYSKALKLIPPTSELWQMEAPGNAPLCRMASGLLSKNEAEILYQSIYDHNPDINVRASALLELTKLSFMYNETDTFNKRYNELEKIRHNVSSFIKTEMYMMRPNRRLANGSDIPNFNLQLLDPDVGISNSNLKGKYYLLDFWGTWCKPCIEEMPYLHQAYSKFKGLNFEILSIAYDDSPEKIKRFREKWEMPWKHAIINSSVDDVHKKFDVWHVPSAFLISPVGKIIGSEFMLRGDALIETLRRVLPK